MKKKLCRENGMAISGILYTLLILFLALLFGILGLITTGKTSLDKLKNDVYTKLNNMENYGQLVKTKYPNGTAVYFNPITGKKCSDYSINGLTYCLKWYAFNDTESSTTLNLLLETEINYSKWNSTNSNTTMLEVETALANLTLESDWQVTPRLITADEIANIVGASNDATLKFTAAKTYVASPTTLDLETEVSWLYLDGGANTNRTSYSTSDGWQKQFADDTTKSNYAWLYDDTNSCMIYGCNEESLYSSGDYAYWTSSKVVGSTTDVWVVNREGKLTVGASNQTYQVRPVITISKILLQ